MNDNTDMTDPDDVPDVDAKASRVWLHRIEEAEKAFEYWQERCDNIDKLYADLKRLATDNRDREFQMFWANIEVLKPSIYARPPVPVVVPKFKDRRPLYQAASELLERCCIVAFDLTDIDSTMRLVRDDLAVVGRGSPWIRYETGKKGERVCIEQKDRKDFLHGVARNWSEVPWVAAASYMTRAEMRKRFAKTSGKAYQTAEYIDRSDDNDQDGAVHDRKQRAKVWEVWSKVDNRVVWVSNGCDKLLDDGEPHLTLEGFFPCPKPAYATLQRGTLIPVPDFVFYKDQLEEINELTGRIHALAEAVKVRGFYPAGAGEIGDAIETAIKSNDDGRVLVPISSWAAFGNGSAKDTIVWLPIDQIVTTIASLVDLRRQVIDDVYQIMGLSDIMRGATDPKETLGAQQLKSQYGSVRIRDKQSELVRVARDALRIAAEIIAENFSQKTMLDMSQLDLPHDADIAKQVAALQEQGKQIAAQAQAQPDPQAIQQAQAQIQQLGQQAQKLQETPTIEKIVAFLHDQRTRAFVLDIETDSTIQPDEDAEKQRRTEFLQVLGTTLGQLGQMVEVEPASAAFAAQVLKFAIAPFRAGRELDAAIEDFANQMAQKAGQPKQDPAAAKAEADAQVAQREMQIKERELSLKVADDQRKQQAAQLDTEARVAEEQHKAAIRERESEQTMRLSAEKHQQDMQAGALDIEKRQVEIEGLRLKAAVATQGAIIKEQQAASADDRAERSFQREAASADA